MWVLATVNGQRREVEAVVEVEAETETESPVSSTQILGVEQVGVGVGLPVSLTPAPGKFVALVGERGGQLLSGDNVLLRLIKMTVDLTLLDADTIDADMMPAGIEDQGILTRTAWAGGRHSQVQTAIKQNIFPTLELVQQIQLPAQSKKDHITARGTAKTKLERMGCQPCARICSSGQTAPSQPQKSTVTVTMPLTVIASTLSVHL
ncbi:hypothetical protein B0H14DRAFT_2631122 [Mycena olivaceomarginata]|nr:hypothetical protein B0H14DRAFT_2631122 [Mycena olivaceomarginata]